MKTLRGALWGLGVALVPLLVALLFLCWLVPSGGVGFPGLVAAIAHRSPILFGAGLFIVLSALARYWLDRLGGRRAPQPRTGGSPRALGGLAAAIVGAICAALLFRAFVIRPFRVSGTSMLPTLEHGDIVGGRSPSRNALRRGDLVVLRADSLDSVRVRSGALAQGELVKRIVGLPGDRIGMRGATPVINGWVVPSCDAGEYLALTGEAGQAVHGRLRVEFLDDRAYLTVSALTRPFPETYLVKPGEVFVLGDNRGNSLDSRALGGGRGSGAPLDAVEARVDRFLLGAHRSGDIDLGRLLGAIDGLQLRPRIEGIDTKALEDGVARCLASRPGVTRPPPPEAEVTLVERSSPTL